MDRHKLLSKFKNNRIMKRHDYESAIKNDIIYYIVENGITITESNRSEIEERLLDELWNEDSVTGNASGSYTYNQFTAEENLCHNWVLLASALDEFGAIENPLKDGAEKADVAIRCYLLQGCLHSVINGILLNSNSKS